MPRERYQEPTLEQTKRGVWFFRARVDKVGKDGLPTRLRETITIGAMGKREAVIKMREIMKTINNSDYVIKSQIPVNDLLDRWVGLHVNRQKKSTQDKYKNLLKNHVRPAFGEMMLCDFGDSLKLQQWIDGKKEAGLGWHFRTDLRNTLSSIFTKAIEWKIWSEENPVQYVHVGRKTVVWARRKLTDDEIRWLLAELPFDVRVACAVALFCTLRISEILAVQEKHIDFENNILMVRQRYYRGDLDSPKSFSSSRDVSLGYLTDDIRKLCLGDPEHFVFQFKTRPAPGKTALCRDDCSLRRYFLTPAAKKVGCYFPGFGFHSLRREAITGNKLDPLQNMRMAGHSKVDMTGLYELADRVAQDKAVRERQEKLLGATPEGKSN